MILFLRKLAIWVRLSRVFQLTMVLLTMVGLGCFSGLVIYAHTVEPMYSQSQPRGVSFSVALLPNFAAPPTPTATATLIVTTAPTASTVATPSRTATPISLATPTPTLLATSMPSATPSLVPTITPTVDVEGDSDFDGIGDRLECEDGADCPDSDGDGQADYLDIDSDGDGITDRVEAVVIAIVERSIRPVDLDGDGLPDYLDPDSDNDTLPDALEGHDADYDGIADVVAVGLDSDNDGLDEAYDTVQRTHHSRGNAAGSNAPLPSTSGGLPNWRNADDDADTIPTIEEIGRNRALPIDEDRNGIPDYLQPRVVRYLFVPLISGDWLSTK